jgi:hypothetical protein
MLRYETKKIINSYDLDRLIRETYGKPYMFQQQDGCKSRGVDYITIPVREPDYYENTSLEFEINGDEMGVSFDTWLNTTVEEINELHPESYKGQNDLWWERNFYPHIETIVNDLYERGLIEAGEYMINIDW